MSEKNKMGFRRFKFNQSTIVKTTPESISDADFVSEQ